MNLSFSETVRLPVKGKISVFFTKLTGPGNSGFNRGLFHEGKPFYRKLFRLAGPIASQNLLVSALAMVDTLMVGQLGAVPIAAVGLGGMFFFLTTLFYYGVASGSAVFVAQYWGNRDIQGIRRTIGMALLLSELGGLVFSVLAVAAPESIMRIFTPDPAVVKTGIVYLRITGFGFLFSGVTLTYSLVLRSIDEAKLPLVASVIVFFVNTILDYVLIFGHLGFPVLGVQGAAIATTISRFLEMLIILIVIYRRGNAAAGKLRELLDFTIPQVRKFLKTTVPVISNELGWAAGAALFKMVYARMGTDILAAVNITETIGNLFFSFFIGSANACAIMIGNRIGDKDTDAAQRYAGEFTIFSFLLGMVLGIFLAIMAPFVPEAFKVGPDIKRIVMIILFINAFFFPVESLNLHYIIGVLRGGGDTTFAFLLDLAITWVIGIPLAFFAGLVLHCSIYVLIVLLGLEEVVKTGIGVIRVHSKKWINNVTEE